MHLIVPFAGTVSEAGRQALGTLALPRLERWLARADPAQTLGSDEFSLSAPHEHAIAAGRGWPAIVGVLPWAAARAAEAGLDERAISFTKGCYPGQEPVARLHYRGHANRALRVLAVDGEIPAYDTELTLDGKAVGRVTSAGHDPEHGVVALAYVRREVAPDAVLKAGDASAQLEGEASLAPTEPR